MPTFDFVVETPISQSIRARQVASAFDVPMVDRARIEYKGALPLEERGWSVGLIVGPSGCGKTTLLRKLFGEPSRLTWKEPSVVDDFDPRFTVEEVTQACSAVGFNTIPAWLRPYAVLSNGEQFRVGLARLLLECEGMAIVDEFTSVVDRQVAKIGAHAVQKYVRRREGLRFVAASCHSDIIEWLQPDWTFEPATNVFSWRSLQRRPALECEIRAAPWDCWREFAPFHYLTAELHRSAKCFVLAVEGVRAAFGGMLYRPHAKVRDIWGLSRLVTLPDYQGLGLAFVLTDRLASAYKARGLRFHTYPAHPSLVRSFDRSPMWELRKAPGRFSSRPGASSLIKRKHGRPCAVFEYVGPAMEDSDLAHRLIGR